LHSEETRVFQCSRSLFALVAATAVASAASETSAQSRQDRRDADAAPCTAPTRLAVVPDGQGFSIAAARTPLPTPAAAPVPLGEHLMLDRALFESAAHDLKEASNAPRR